MLLRDLTEVWVSEYKEVKEHGEKTKKWKFKGIILSVEEVNKEQVQKLNQTKVNKLCKEYLKSGMAYLNLQHDVNELDRNSAGTIDYSIINARTTMNYDIQKGDGISLTDISDKEEFVPDYTVTDNPKIGNTTLYKLEKYNGD